MWSACLVLSEHKFNGSAESLFENLPQSLIKNTGDWHKWYNETEPEYCILPEEFENILKEKDYRLSVFLKSLLIRSLRKDRLKIACLKLIKETLNISCFEKESNAMENT